MNIAGGQADYSAQWVEYYRSMGMVREAEAIEQQAKSLKQQQATAAAPAAAPQPQQPQQQPVRLAIAFILPIEKCFK